MCLVICYSEHGLHIISCFSCLSFRQPGSSYVHSRKFHNSGSQHARIGLVLAREDLSQCSSLIVGRRSHGRPLGHSCDSVLHNNAVSRCVYIRQTRPHLLIYHNRTTIHFYSGIL